MRLLLLLGALALSTHVAAQAVRIQTLPAQTPLAPALEVQRLAPQLVAFAGGDANFQNLVNGLATGTQVTLVSGNQVVTFTPSTTMTPLQIAQTLESVRQSLITRGIAAPTAQQLATALVGGALPTALGTTQVNGVVSSTTPLTTSTIAQPQSPAVAIQGSRGAAAAGSSAAIRGNTSDSPLTRGISDTPPSAVPGTPTAPTNVTPAPTGSASVRVR
jgi:hypothetical protein